MSQNKPPKPGKPAAKPASKSAKAPTKSVLPQIMGLGAKSHPSAPKTNQPAQSAAPRGVAMRLDPDDHEIVTEYARNKGMSIQELLETAVNLMREAEGLAPIRGRPRSVTRIARMREI